PSNVSVMVLPPGSRTIAGTRVRPEDQSAPSASRRYLRASAIMNDAIATDPITLHRGLLTPDTHIDIPWPTGPDPFQDGPRLVDLPKMHRGGLAAGCFAAYVPQAARTPENETAAFERAMGMLQAIRAMGRSENGVNARVAVTADEIATCKRDGVLAIVPAV